ncbi:protein of unknown function [Shewanella benthica]|uniref:Uncharacterized protein n=1 Tax=Shewanella benthica TaxID=43661 RepID=A0A330M2N3_9GAMM|nr:protein of unknown function [Shewanella benthica]
MKMAASKMIISAAVAVTQVTVIWADTANTRVLVNLDIRRLVALASESNSRQINTDQRSMQRHNNSR